MCKVMHTAHQPCSCTHGLLYSVSSDYPVSSPPLLGNWSHCFLVSPVPAQSRDRGSMLHLTQSIYAALGTGSQGWNITCEEWDSETVAWWTEMSGMLGIGQNTVTAGSSLHPGEVKWGRGHGDLQLKRCLSWESVEMSSSSRNSFIVFLAR